MALTTVATCYTDFADPFLNEIYILAIDAHSKWPDIFKMMQTSTTKTIAIFRHISAKYGLPQQVVSATALNLSPVSLHSL
jgi:hypothetical protein